jgi:uncharacterized protein
MHEIILPLAILTTSGTVAGFLAGLFGVGGGLIFIPVLFFLFVATGMEATAAMSLAVGTSLATIVFSGSASAVAHYRLRNIEFRIIKLWVAPLIVGVFIASHFIKPAFGKMLLLVFVCLLLFIAINTFVNVPGKISVAAVSTRRASKLLQLCTAFFIGLISVMAGVGGGTLSVPAMLVAGVDTHRAVGTSSLLGLCIAVPATLLFIFLGNTPANAPPYTYGTINYLALPILAVSSMCVAPLGAQVGKRLSGTALRKGFALCLLCVALSMLMRGF